MARNPRIRLASKTGKPVVKEVKALKRIKLMNEPPGPLPKGLHDKVLEDFRKETKRLKADASRTAGETKGPRGMGKTKAQKAAATRALNIEESKRKGTYTGKASKLKQKVKVKSRAGGAAFNPKLLGSRYSPTDFTRGGRGPSGIPRKKL